MTKTPTTTLVHLGWPLLLSDGGEVRIRDIDLAEKLRYARPRKIRDLIKKLIDEGKLSEDCERTVRGRSRTPTGGEVVREVIEYHLTREQALKVAARSETDVADALLTEMIHVFTLALDGKLVAADDTPKTRELKLYLLEERVTLERLFEPHFIAVICRLHGTSYKPGDHAPVWFRGFVGRMYKLMLGENVRLEMKSRGNNRDLYEFLTPDALRLVRTHMDFISGIARQCRTMDELTRRLRTHFVGDSFQFSIEGLEEDGARLTN